MVLFYIILKKLGTLENYMQKSEIVQHYIAIKINSMWSKDLHIKLESIKLLEENRSNRLLDISPSNIIMDLLFQVRATKAN